MRFVDHPTQKKLKFLDLLEKKNNIVAINISRMNINVFSNKTFFYSGLFVHLKKDNKGHGYFNSVKYKLQH